jgi:hypothetical protein
MPRGAAVPLVIAVLACGADGAAPVLRAVAEGRRPLADASVRYREEVPGERTFEVALAGDGRVTITEASRPPRVRTLAPAAHRALIAQLAEPALATIPREVEVMPGAPRLQLVAMAGGELALEVLASVATAEREPTMRQIRARMRALAE